MGRGGHDHTSGAGVFFGATLRPTTEELALRAGLLPDALDSRIIKERLAVLDRVELVRSRQHYELRDSCPRALSPMEMITWLVGEPAEAADPSQFATQRRYISPFIQSQLRNTIYLAYTSDVEITKEERDALKGLLPELIGSRPQDDAARKELVTYWLLHTHIPAWLRQIGENEFADEVQYLHKSTQVDREDALTSMRRILEERYKFLDSFSDDGGLDDDAEYLMTNSTFVSWDDDSTFAEDAQAVLFTAAQVIMSSKLDQGDDVKRLIATQRRDSLSCLRSLARPNDRCR